MALPNPSMSFTPFDILTAEEMNNLVENIESLAAGTGFTAGSIPNSAMQTNAQPQQIASDVTFDFVRSGLVITGDSYGSTRAASITAGVVYINGIRIAVSASVARIYTASRDVYVDVNSSGTLVFTDVTNNAASPSLAANSIRIGIVVVGASSITSVAAVNQGQEGKILPIASGIPYMTTDSLGNLICPRDPARKTLGYREIIADVTTAGGNTQITGLSVPVIVPAGRKVKITLFGWRVLQATANTVVDLSIWDGAVGGTQIGWGRLVSATANAASPLSPSTVRTPSTTSKTYNGGIANLGGSLATIGGDPKAPAYILVELE